MIDMTGLAARPSQTWGAVRLVPLVREDPVTDLRLDLRAYGDELSEVSLPDRSHYIAYVPHAFVASWTTDGTPAATYGTQLGSPERHVALRFRRRMARRLDKNRLRFLPLHLALEGFLALHFGGPEIAWQEWSHRAVTHGLSPRAEEAYTGAAIRGLDDALRVFEIHPGQCGMVLYTGDALAGAFVVPHPDDYRALHPTLVKDMYGEQVYHYALYHRANPMEAAIDDALVSSLAGLREQAARREREWAEFHDDIMAAGMIASPARIDEVYRLGRFRLRRFLPAFEPRRENHIGEMIVDDGGRLAYLKTFRLSEAQIRRGHLLTLLAAHDWSLPGTAAALGDAEAALGVRLARAGLGHLLRPDLLAAYRKALR
ncbi:hypothetical protein [Spongiactinospora sp. TRM90649]|uniref:ARPP-2 domain-containing protein n=1 Tax=Spongiactinospora sp. TRM90649 TaxID=3031114 RepID=UPI0023F93C21|nr:hypothetical protein [Spongiactinospora sp. TRM90649]MDF5752966.1 hypothetical protein [Spongiactinospora sp. TRM90649]